MNRRAFLKSLGVAPLVPLVAIVPALAEKPATERNSIVVKRGAENVIIQGNAIENGGNIVVEGGTNGVRISDVLLR